MKKKWYEIILIDTKTGEEVTVVRAQSKGLAWSCYTEVKKLYESRPEILVHLK